MVTPRSLNTALAVVLVALVAALAVLTLRADDPAAQLRRAAWLEEDAGPGALTVAHRDVALAARAEVLALLTVDHRNMEPLVERVLDGATGEFARDYAARRSDLVARAREQQSVSTGSVAALGVADLRADSAAVLVAANSRVRNVETNGAPRTDFYRLRLEMALVDGRWLLADLETVR